MCFCLNLQNRSFSENLIDNRRNSGYDLTTGKQEGAATPTDKD
ncbi:hypothetical protein HMPREF0239_05005 [Clostridium sp. ATCC BAA-442]|nr:hypothetical protein HMPREF0239_05005 [Clostridium sp. ATCC BAA-442]